MSHKENNKIIILFDGVCNLCLGSVKFIIKRDLNDIFRFASIQSSAGEELLNQYKIDIGKNDSIIVIFNNNIKFRSSAVLYILSRLKTFWRCLLILYIIPYPIRDLIYFFVAKNRYSTFGKKEKCLTPSNNIKSKFLSL